MQLRAELRAEACTKPRTEACTKPRTEACTKPRTDIQRFMLAINYRRF